MFNRITDLFRSTCRHLVSRGAAATYAAASIMLAAGPASAIDVDPGDYTALPPGTSAFLLYGQYAQRNSINVLGTGTIGQGYELDSAVGIARFVHWIEIAGIVVDPQILIPVGSLYNGRLAGSRVPSATGLANPIVAATAWLINKPDPVYATYFGITPFFTIPIGKFDPNAALNIGSDTFQATLQAGYIQGFAPKFHFEFYGDATFSTDSRVGGPARQSLQQDPSFQLQSYLRYEVADGIFLTAGHSYTFGGDQYIGGIRNGLRTEGHQVRGIVQAFLDPTTQIQVGLFHDFGVRGGFAQDVGVRVRYLKIFAASN